MGYFKNLVIEVGELRKQGFSKEAIANEFNLDVDDVTVIFDILNEEDIYND